jgi:hypothetical protein
MKHINNGCCSNSCFVCAQHTKDHSKLVAKIDKMRWIQALCVVICSALTVASPLTEPLIANGQKIKGRAPVMPVITLPSGSYKATYYDQARDVRKDIISRYSSSAKE